MEIDLGLVAERKDGIFYVVLLDGIKLCWALTHAYPALDGKGWEPKTPDGEYIAKRGTHTLHNGVPFETFEITGVPGHSGILFHKGNFNRDSEGCYLLGELDTSNAAWDVLSSGIAFGKFMTALEGFDNVALRIARD